MHFISKCRTLNEPIFPFPNTRNKLFQNLWQTLGQTCCYFVIIYNMSVKKQKFSKPILELPHKVMEKKKGVLKIPFT